MNVLDVFKTPYVAVAGRIGERVYSCEFQPVILYTGWTLKYGMHLAVQLTPTECEIWRVWYTRSLCLLEYRWFLREQADTRPDGRWDMRPSLIFNTSKSEAVGGRTDGRGSTLNATS